MNLTRTSVELVPTITTEQIWTALDITRKRAFFTLIFGETGRSKTLTAMHWAEKNDATMVRCLTGTNRAKLLKKMTKAITGVSGSDSTDREERIIDTLLKTEKHTIIIDEVNHLLRIGNTMTKANSLDFLRDIYDEMREVHNKPVGIALIFTNYTFDEFKHGPMCSFLEQFSGRMGYHVQIPNEVFLKKEIIPIVKAYVQSPDDKLLKTAHSIASAKGGKLRTLVKYLELAKEYAQDHKGTISSTLLEKIQKRYEKGGVWKDEDDQAEE
jgi:Cdc6-like AAA superfamily ATPase